MAKLYASEAGGEVRQHRHPGLGGSGYVTSTPSSGTSATSRVTTLYEGTSQIQQLLIGRAETGIDALTAGGGRARAGDCVNASRGRCGATRTSNPGFRHCLMPPAPRLWPPPSPPPSRPRPPRAPPPTSRTSPSPCPATLTAASVKADPNTWIGGAMPGRRLRPRWRRASAPAAPALDRRAAATWSSARPGAGVRGGAAVRAHRLRVQTRRPTCVMSVPCTTGLSVWPTLGGPVRGVHIQPQPAHRQRRNSPTDRARRRAGRPDPSQSGTGDPNFTTLGHLQRSPASTAPRRRPSPPRPSTTSAWTASGRAPARSTRRSRTRTRSPARTRRTGIRAAIVNIESTPAPVNPRAPGVINMSYGAQNSICLLDYADLEIAHSLGIVAVAGGGQRGHQDARPARLPGGRCPHVLTVGATDPHDQRVFFSNPSPAIDLSAPGIGIVTAVPPAFDKQPPVDGYEALSGTSFSTPMVSAGVAWSSSSAPPVRRPGRSGHPALRARHHRRRAGTPRPDSASSTSTGR